MAGLFSFSFLRTGLGEPGSEALPAWVPAGLLARVLLWYPNQSNHSSTLK
jgi:hypothetical protein